MSRPKGKCEHSLYLGKLIHDLLVDLSMLGHYTGTGIVGDGWLVCCVREDTGLYTVSIHELT